MNIKTITAVLIFATFLVGSTFAGLTNLNVPKNAAPKQICDSGQPWNMTMDNFLTCRNQSKNEGVWAVYAFVYPPSFGSNTHNISELYLEAFYLPGDRKINRYIPIASNSIVKTCVNYNNTIQCLYTTYGKTGWSKSKGWYALVSLKGTERHS